MFKAAIFDLDGTLLDSMGIWDVITENFFINHNITDVSREEIYSYKEMAMHESIPLIKKRHNLELSEDEIRDEFINAGEYEYTNNVCAKPYASEYLKKLYNSGIKLGIATSGYPKLCTVILKRLDIFKYIQSISYSSEVKVNKSKPDIYLLTAKRLNVKPNECMVYEDIPTGISGAKAANMMTTAIYDPTNEAQTAELKKLADFYINGWYELL